MPQTVLEQPATQSAAGSAHLTKVHGWGCYPSVEAYELLSEDLERITEGAMLTRGLGRSYGDASLPPPGGHVVAGSRLADRILSFDSATGVLRAEAGLSLVELNRLFRPKGWFTPVSPGTQYVTLGGMVAADVHGKNHHASGTFGRHVSRLRMRVADGRILEVSGEDEPELFRATLGGMGLTGHILEVELEMKAVPSQWIYGESEPVPNLDVLVEKLVEAGKSWPYTVGWADCLGRGATMGRGSVIKGRWAEASEAPARAPATKGKVDVPVLLPDWFLNRLNIRAFNELKYRAQWGVRKGFLHPQSFFYPLDAILNWNRFYGARGFTQYQCVLPPSGGASYRKLFEILLKNGGTPFLVVVKDFGAEGRGMLSFPRPGLTFAIDMPIVAGETQALVDTLNEFVAGEGGRVYLAKDAFTRPEHYRAMDPRVDAWNEVRRSWDPDARLRSSQSVRLFGDEP